MRLLGFGTAIGIGGVVALALTIVVAVVAAPTLVRSIGSWVPTDAPQSAVVEAPPCPNVPSRTVGGIVVPAGPIAGYCQDRLVNAAEIMLAARAMGIGAHTQAIGVMTAMGESSLVNIDYGDAVGPDSRGLFQQRDNGEWGSYSDRMTPSIAATHFFQKLVKIPDWKGLSPIQAAHAVQVNADPNHYTRYWAPAVDVVDALSGQ